MNIKYLLGGQRAPEGWDFIKIDRLSEDCYNISGAIAISGGGILKDMQYATLDKAKEAALSWASEQGSQIIYLEMP